MKILKKLFLIFVSILMLITNFNIKVLADDGDTTIDPSFTATYEFVLDSENREDLPDEVLSLLPDTITDLKPGDIITNDNLPEVETDEAIYSFKEWNYNEYTIEDSDIHFVGTWTKADKSIDPADNSDNSENTENSDDTTTNPQDNSAPVVNPAPANNQLIPSDNELVVHYHFVIIKDGKYESSDLPDDIMALLPKDKIVSINDIENYPTLDKTNLSGYRFVGWEGGVNYDTKTLTHIGKWEAFTGFRSIPHPGTTPDAVAGPQYSVPMGGTVGGSTLHFTLSGEEAFCVEPDERTYALPNTGFWITGGIPSRWGEIIYLGNQNGMSYGAIQAALWNEMYGYQKYSYGGENVDPNSSTYNSNGRLACWGNYYETSDYGGTLTMQSLAKDIGCRIVRTPHGYVNVKKVAANTSFNYTQNCPNNYSLKGAEYGVYTDAQCTNEVASLTTDENGNTPNTGDLNPGTYYVKEKKASPGFKLDTTAYRVVVPDSDTPVTVTSTEQPIDDPFSINLFKLDKRNSKFVPHLDEAEFTLKYWDAQTNNPTGSPKYTWVFKPIFNAQGKAVVVFDKAHYISGPTNMFDSNNVLHLPLGTFTIEETKAPKLFVRDENIYVGHVVDKGGYAEAEVIAKGWLDVDNEDLSQTENLQTVSLIIQKVNQDTNTNQLPTEDITNTATLEGAVFRIYRTGEYNTDKNNPQLVDITPVDYGTITTDATGKAELKYERVNGVDSSFGLLPGKFKIVEEKAPNGFTLNTNEFVINAPIKDNIAANFEYSITVGDKLTQIQIEKLDDNGEQVPYSAGAIIQLIETTSGKVVFEFTYDGKPKVIKGLTTLLNYRLHELSVSPNYQLAPDKDVTPIDEDDSSLHTYHMIDHKIVIHTTAYFDNNGKKAWDDQSNKHYVADGIAHIYDDVTYKNLTANDDYVLVGTLYDLTDDAMLTTTVRHPFKPKFSVGQETLKFDQNLDGLDNHTLVVFEELYHVTPTGEVLVSEHKDKTDANQTIYVDKLYKADFEILKVDADTNQPLEGVEFNVKYSRTRRDGTLEEVDLGKFTTDVNGKITINNIKEDSTLTVTETKAKDYSYFKWENPFTYQLGHDTSLTKLEVQIENHQLKLATKALVKETGTQDVPADAIVTIVDIVDYKWLDTERQHILKGKIYDVSNNALLAEAQLKFTHTNKDGSVEVIFDNFDVTKYPNKTLGIVEELYTIVDDGTGQKEVLVSTHNANLADTDQMIHVRELYKAAMVMYKSNASKSIRLNGAVFTITTKRTKFNGTLVEENLGKYVSGGIYYEQQQAFEYVIAKNDDMSNVVTTLTSKNHDKFNTQYIQTTELEDGIYYGQVVGSSNIKKWYVSKGMIYLEDVIEDTEITYHEEIAPIGYHLPQDDFVVNVGHDKSLSRIENYRPNDLIIRRIPKTGIE